MMIWKCFNKKAPLVDSDDQEKHAEPATRYVAAARPYVAAATPYEPAATPYEPAATPYEAAENAKAAKGDNDDTSGRRSRLGHIFCGGLCDMRIATVIINSINIIFRVVCLVFELIWGDYYATAVDYCSLILSVIAVFGALNYDVMCTTVATVGQIWFLGVYIADRAMWPLYILDTLMIYSTGVVTYEIYIGIMSKKTYSREEYLEPVTRSYIQTMV